MNSCYNFCLQKNTACTKGRGTEFCESVSCRSIEVLVRHQRVPALVFLLGHATFADIGMLIGSSKEMALLSRFSISPESKVTRLEASTCKWLPLQLMTNALQRFAVRTLRWKPTTGRRGQAPSNHFGYDLLAMDFHILISHSFMADDTYRELGIPDISRRKSRLNGPYDKLRVCVKLSSIDVQDQRDQTWKRRSGSVDVCSAQETKHLYNFVVNDIATYDQTF